MKKILLSLLMLCTMVSAWSQTTETVTITCGGTNNSPFTVQAQSGSDGAEGALYWLVRSGNNLKLNVQQGYYVTKVEFAATDYGTVDECDKLIRQGKAWVRGDGDTNYYDVITFSNFESDITKVSAITVTYYHVCYGETHHEAVPGTCITKGRAEYWECVCGKVYSDAGCSDVVTDMATLDTDINPKNHATTLTKEEAVAATCVSKGSMEHWYCKDCGHRFYDEAGQNQIANDNVATDIDPKNHVHGLEEHAQVNATCKDTGTYGYFSCADCKKNFTDEGGTTEISSEDLIISIDPKAHAVELTKVDAVAATCVSEGSMEHWFCSDCNHRFSDEAGKNQIAGDNVTTDLDPTNHNGKLSEVAFKNASVVEDGVYHHWHCQACGNDYADADATENINGKTAKAKYDADALLIGNTTVDESYLFDGATVTFDGDNVVLAMGDDKQQYELSETERLMINFSHTFQLKANKDPNHTTNYYSTFYTSEGAYKVPETAKAYAGEVKSGEETDVLNLTNVGSIIHASEAVILKATGSDITLMPSCNKTAASTENVLEGTDVAKTLGADQYALSLGQNGVGFYLWNGKEIGANKAYLTLNASFGAKAFTFQFDNGETTAIEQPAINGKQSGDTYNLNGVRVNDNYKGIVIKNGKKIYQK